MSLILSLALHANVPVNDDASENPTVRLPTPPQSRPAGRRGDGRGSVPPPTLAVRPRVRPG